MGYQRNRSQVGELPCGQGRFLHEEPRAKEAGQFVCVYVGSLM